MQPKDPASTVWVGSWDFYQKSDKGYYAEYGGNLVEEFLGHWIFLSTQALIQWKTEINTYVVDPYTNQSTLLESQTGVPFIALWSTDYNQFRSYPYYNLAIATSLIGGGGLNFDQETGQGFYDTSSPDINWQTGYYYEFNDLNKVTLMYDPEDPYESPMVFTRTGSPESWGSELYNSELHFGLDFDQDGFIGNQSEVRPYGNIIQSVIGKGKLKGTGAADIFMFERYEVFKKKNADTIIEFNPSHGDSIAVSRYAFPALQGATGINFASTKHNKELKLLSKQGYDFVYFEKKARLYFDGNGTGKGWGNQDDGGLVAVLLGNPELAVDYFTLLA